MTIPPISIPYNPLSEVTVEVGGKENVESLQRVARDFRSDTLTVPTDAQLLHSLKASRGDDVYSEDPSTTALERRVAKLTGKEAAMFAVSGTMTNQLAIRTHMKQPPHSVITDYRAHVHKMEAGGIAMFSQATTHQLFPSNGLHLTAEDIEPQLQLGTNIHISPTRLICLENTLSGIIFPQEEIVKIGELAKQNDIGLHLDGARIWNVAADPPHTSLTELLEPFDSASLCLSKGLGAPIGSILVGSKEFIERAKWFRKAFGGGIRQCGGIAASADYALTHHFPRLAHTHKLAKRLEGGLKELGVNIAAPVDTNMVFFQPQAIGLPLDAVMARLAALPNPIIVGRERCVVHHQITPQAVEDFIACVREMREEKKANGQVEEDGEGIRRADKEKLEYYNEPKGKTTDAVLRKQAALGY
ncbi:threonine aldolase [Kwoniella mangroviensis CBS 10435]|uniref:Threonine aldolase n=1 Tax=Kwoniella mangroviensis CBS 10435 TaxID=1331196 RepID=A0A1B9IIP4_9TREE|nr:threonine aldolase [Kwoniella mangroviensis CBS 8507]OCF55539.1 threonine aldolase [Kwoniella mangroviensis CBS 10435]OCF63302.1 threonine aldolase [Kwoniella mangroviensis CBS 8507]OCF73729.1 threonine aldolase [Kwoniella mangroviensis CBS 8886]